MVDHTLPANLEAASELHGHLVGTHEHSKPHSKPHQIIRRPWCCTSCFLSKDHDVFHPAITWQSIAVHSRGYTGLSAYKNETLSMPINANTFYMHGSARHFEHLILTQVNVCACLCSQLAQMYLGSCKANFKLLLQDQDAPSTYVPLDRAKLQTSWCFRIKAHTWSASSDSSRTASSCGGNSISISTNSVTTANLVATANIASTCVSVEVWRCLPYPLQCGHAHWAEQSHLVWLNMPLQQAHVLTETVVMTETMVIQSPGPVTQMMPLPESTETCPAEHATLVVSSFVAGGGGGGTFGAGGGGGGMHSYSFCTPETSHQQTSSFFDVLKATGTNTQSKHESFNKWFFIIQKSPQSKAQNKYVVQVKPTMSEGLQIKASYFCTQETKWLLQTQGLPYLALAWLALFFVTLGWGWLALVLVLYAKHQQWANTTEAGQMCKPWLMIKQVLRSKVANVHRIFL